VVHPDTGNRKGIGVSAFLLALVTAGAMAHVGVRMKGIEVAYDLGRERRINTQLEEERRRLNIEIGMLKDPVRVVSIARDKLKMGPPAPEDVVRLAPGQVLGAHEAEVAAAAAAKQAEKAAKAARRELARQEKAKRAANGKEPANAKDSANAKAPAKVKDSQSGSDAPKEDLEMPRSTGQGDE
jgi:cell division protein FtsL